MPAAQSVVTWLIDGARSAPLAQDVLTELCERLTAAGLPLWRVVVFVRTLHPQVVGRRFVWRPDTGTAVSDGSFELLERDIFSQQPDGLCRYDRRGAAPQTRRSRLPNGFFGPARSAR